MALVQQQETDDAASLVRWCLCSAIERHFVGRRDCERLLPTAVALARLLWLYQVQSGLQFEPQLPPVVLAVGPHQPWRLLRAVLAGLSTWTVPAFVLPR